MLRLFHDTAATVTAIAGQTQQTPSIVLIGYGNELCGDDGIGPTVARRIAQRQMPQVRSLYVHQLTPELSAQLVDCDWVIFVDACQGQQTVIVKKVELDKENSHTLPILGHTSDPPMIMMLTQMLYGNQPQAWWVQVPGQSFAIGDPLSAIAQQGIDEAIQVIDELLSVAPIHHKCHA